MEVQLSGVVDELTKCKDELTAYDNEKHRKKIDAKVSEV